MSLTLALGVRANKPKRNTGLIEAGWTNSAAIDKNGRAWAWGVAIGIGDNTVVNKATPVSVAGAVKTFCQISSGNAFSLAIDKNGRLWSWGNNIQGQLGDNSITQRLTPVSVAGAVKTFCKIAAGGNNNFSIAIDKNGRLWGWGFNNLGQVGDNTTTSRRTPVSVAGAVKTFCQISAGGATGVAIDKNGRAWGWGLNIGNIGDNTTTTRGTPVSVAGAVKTFCQISAGIQHTLAIDKNGRVWTWGNNSLGQLGDNSITSKLVPVSVLGAVKTFCQISGGSASHSLAIDKNGRAWAWGDNARGQLGDNSIISKRTPVSVLGAVKTFCQISGGDRFSLAIDKNGRAWGWGYNTFGSLGINSAPIKYEPTNAFGAVKTFCQISAGANFSVAIDKNGYAWSAGANDSGGLGDNSITQRVSPVSVLGAVKTFCQIANAFQYTLAIDKNGRAWAWGLNGNGQLGDNTTTSRRTPVSVAGAVKTFCKIWTSSENFTSHAIDKNGRAWGWASNGNGNIGDNTTIQKLTPVSVAGAVKTFCQIAGGNNHAIALAKNGRVWTWGNNSEGQLGDNSITQRLTPVSVAGAVKTFCQISSGNAFSLAIDKNGRAWAWGGNGKGQLGDNSITSRRTPVSVAGAVKTFCQIRGGGSAAAAIDKNGRLWTWGNNDNAQLGDNTTTSRRTPVSVAGAVKTFCKISVGSNHCLAIDKNGTAWGWGFDLNGQLGTNVILSVLTPVRVCNI
jgi:alpha-tubulin suppressor-like RCC1 family protein